jgi:hypothetical protein
MDSNIKPANVGAIVRTPILAELLIPIAVAVSSGETIPDAKVCLIGALNNTIIRFKTMKNTAAGYQLESAKNTVAPADNNLVATMVGIVPYLSITLGVTR